MSWQASKLGGGSRAKNGIGSFSGLLRPKWGWTGNHEARLLHLFETGYKSDLMLNLYPEGLRLPVHKIFLEAGSPVLDGKIKPETEEIRIENVDTRVFKMLIKHLYTGKSDVGMGDALQLMQLATEYEVSGLRDECAQILKGDLTLENVLSLFQSGMEYAHGDFIQSTLKFICKNARKVLKSDKFSKLRLECLVEIIQQDSLVVMNEMEVFDAVNRWGIAECLRQNLDPANAESLRKCLAKPLSHIRFSLMDPAEFALNVTTKKLLSMEESMELLNCFLVPPEKRNMLPPGTFVSTPRTYINKDIVLTRTFPEGARLIQSITCAGNPNGSETIMIRVKENVSLKSISVPKEIFDVNPAYLYYYDLIKCTLSCESEVKNVDTLVTKFDTYERGEVYLRISIDPPCRLNVLDGWVKVTMSFSGDVGYHGLTQTVANKGIFDIIQHVFPPNGCNRMITNYVGLFPDPVMEENATRVIIKRRERDQLGVNCGFIEKMEFELV